MCAENNNNKSTECNNNCSITLPTQEDWDELLKKTCGRPRSNASSIPPSVGKFALYAKSQGYSYSQIRDAAEAEFHCKTSVSSLKRYVASRNKS